MQSWVRCSECLFCQFRASFKYSRSRQNSRPYHAKTNSYDDRTQSQPIREPRGREDPVRRNGKVYIPPKQLASALRSSKDTIPSRERKRELAMERFYQTQDLKSRRLDVLKALKQTKAYYMSSKMSKDSNISQLTGLDPDKTLWPQFESMVKQALENKPSSSQQSGLVADLMGSKTEEYRPDLARTLQFAFMDFVLDNGVAIKVGTTEEMDLRYPTEWYTAARKIQRAIHLHVGPTNSGKTYNALKRLEQAQNGFYAGPLRLLAHEVYSRFNNRGIKCDLVTGDDVRMDESGEVELYSSTVEMVDTGRECDVGVIDEIQMMGDNDRGWAWTRAVLGARAKELHLCGEARVVPLIREIVASMGDTLHIHQYQRLNPLKVMSRSLKGNLQNLRKGDCVVSFSIMNIHALKRQIELETGKHCAVIYGGLPPETRAQQAALFNDPDNDYDFLAASDAIGMGLNLSIKRIVFETVRKYNGSFHEQLSIPQIKQIAGRAGRYRTAQDDKVQRTDNTKSGTKSFSRDQTKPQSIGLVTCLDEADLTVLQQALTSEGPPLKAAGILPPGEFYEELASRLPENTPFEFILRRMCVSVATHDRFQLCNIKDQTAIARAVEHIQNLPVADRLLICASPASWRTASSHKVEGVLIALTQAIADNNPVTVADINEIPLEALDVPMSAERTYLISLENLHKSLILFLWLSYRFPRTLRDQDMAVRAKELCEEKINTTLLKFSANPKLRARLDQIRKTSETLRDQAKERGALTGGTPLTMNPDQSVEEINADEALVERQMVMGLEKEVEIQEELDLGNNEEIKGVIGEDNEQSVQELGADIYENAVEPRKASGSG